MESVGSSLMLIILLIGILIILFKKSIKNVGYFLVFVALFFMYIMPFISFNRYKKSTVGIYDNQNSYAIIIINNDEEYLYIRNNNESKGKVKYSNIDSYSFFLEGASQYSSYHENEIINEYDKNDVFVKRNGN